MADVAPNLGVCHRCGEFCEVAYVYPHVGMYCREHMPPVVDNKVLDMIFEKAGVPGPKRHRPWEGILGILFFSKKHHKQAKSEIEQISLGRLLE